MPVPPITRDAITRALRECGPMSVPELVEHLDWPRSRVNACLTTARTNHPGKLFRIVGYRTQVGVQGRETPIYAAVPGPDAKRPEFDKDRVRARKHSYYLRNRARAVVRRKRNAGQHVASPWAGLVPIQRKLTVQAA